MSWVERPRSVVTGAASGLGRGFCLELARRGASILASDIDEVGLAETARQCGGATIHTTTCDVRSADAVAELADQAESLLGGVDLVINNAGLAVGGRVGETSLEDWRLVVDVNLMGVVHGCHTFIPRMREQGQGHILNVASSAGLVCLPDMAPYCATKFAVVALSECLFAELQGTQVGVTVLCPTFFRTNIGKNSRGLGPRHVELVEAFMDRGKLNAEDVARRALDGIQAGELHVLPMPDGKLFWAARRLFPQGYLRWMPTLVRRMAKQMGIDLDELEPQPTAASAPRLRAFFTRSR